MESQQRRIRIVRFFAGYAFAVRFAGTALGLAALGVPSAANAVGGCTGGDPLSNGDLVVGTQIALGTEPVTDCPALDLDADAYITVDDLLRALGDSGARGANTVLPAAAAGPPVVHVGSASGAPGQQVTFAVTLDAAGTSVAGLQNDIAFDSTTIAVATAQRCSFTYYKQCTSNADCPGETCVAAPDCEVNPNINKNQTSFGFQPPGCAGAGCTGLRAIVLSFFNVSTIPDGLLYTCKVNISGGAPPSANPLTVSNVIMSDPVGNRLLGAFGTDGHITVVAAQTATPTASPTPALDPALDLHDGAGQPGGRACIPVTLTAPGSAVVATSNDIGFDSGPFAISSCTLNPVIASQPTNKQLLMSSPGAGLERVAVLGFNSAIIPSGPLFMCEFAIDAGAATGQYLLSNAPSAADSDGNPIPNLGGSAGHIAVTTCTGDCDGNGVVSIGEVVKCINVFLGRPLCDAANPTLNCPAADATGDGIVSIGEAVQCINRFLHDCGAGPTPLPTATRTATATPTPTALTAHCGNGVIEPGEECDLGGICVGTSTAGRHCTSDADCGDTGGRCHGGTKAYDACNADSDCGGGRCVKCETFGGGVIGSGGQTCAANCTIGTDIQMALVPGQTVGTSIQAGTSGSVIYGDILTVPLALTGEQTLTVGKDRGDGIIPFSIGANSINFPGIPVSTIACACLRGIEAKTCGGTLFDLDGVTQSADCSASYTDGDSVCPADKPCAWLHGPGNAGSGLVGCNGYTPVDLDFSQDSRGSSDPTQCATAGTGAPICADPPVINLSGTGGPGSVLLLTNNAIGTVVGMCTGTSAAYGPDHQFCTADDPQWSRGTPAPQFLTAGHAGGVVTNANGVDGADIGPFSVSGAGAVCSMLADGSVSGVVLAGAYTSINQPTLGDIVVTSVYVAQ